YDEGYFQEHDHDLAPDERLQCRPVVTSPAFDSARAPRLDPAAWPDERRHRANRNFARGYVEDGVRTLLEMLGVHAACAVVAPALRLVAIQSHHELRATLGADDGGARGLARLLAALAELAGEEPAVREEGPGRLVIERTPRVLADGGVPAEVHHALFAFPAMCARLQSARVRLAPPRPAAPRAPPPGGPR